MLPRCPIFKPHFHAKVVPGEGLFLLSEMKQTVLQGRLYEVIAPYLDGRPIEQICANLAGQISQPEIFYTLSHLNKKGYLSEYSNGMPASEAALWSLQEIDPSTARQRLAEATVTITSYGVEVRPFVEMLQTLGVRVGAEGTFRLVVTDSYLRNELRELNRESLRDGRPWLLFKPFGCQIWLGPLFRPGDTGCWQCMTQRMRANFPILGYFSGRQELDGSPVGDRSHTPATLAVAWGLAATAVSAWIGRGEFRYLDGKIQSIDTITYQAQTHAVLRLPSCPACGSPPTNEQPKPVALESRSKTFIQDGGHRVRHPEETVNRFSHLVSPICGAVSVLERMGTAGDGIMHVYSSGRNVGRGPLDWFHLKSDLRSGSCGKGVSEAQAKASALCEGLERYSGFFRNDEPRRKARMSELGDDALHPNACMLFSDQQFQEREVINARQSFYNYIPHPFDPEAEIDWTPVWSLTRQAHRYLPTALCYFSYPEPRGADTCIGCSNGNAAGNTLEEAVLQGFLELVERDSIALWWYNRLSMPSVDVDSFSEPYVQQLRAHLAAHCRDLWVLDLTSDLGIPVFAAVSRRTEGPCEQLMFGFGAHLDPRIALLRSVTELNQMIVHLLNAPPDNPGAFLSDYETVHWLKNATVANNSYLLPRPGAPRSASAFQATWHDDLLSDIKECQSRVEQLGLEMLILDQTRPEIGLPTVKVFVPGLRHFWARFAPGRLYEAPVTLGWLERPLAEEQLNPVPMFL